MCSYIFNETCIYNDISYNKGDRCNGQILHEGLCDDHLNDNISVYDESVTDSDSDVDASIQVDNSYIKDILVILSNLDQHIINKDKLIRSLTNDNNRLQLYINDLESCKSKYTIGSIITTNDGRIKRFDGTKWLDKCTTKNCINKPLYGYEVNMSVKCIDHKTSNMRTVIGIKCKQYVTCGNIVNRHDYKEFNGLCLECNSINMSDSDRLISYVKSNLMDEPWFASGKFNNILFENRQIDILFRNNTGCIVVECLTSKEYDISDILDNKIRSATLLPTTIIYWNPLIMEGSPAPLESRIEVLSNEILECMSNTIEDETITLYFPL